MHASPQGVHRVGIDIGGTFTDLSIVGAAGIVAVGKTLTTHRAPAQGVVDALTEALEESGVEASSITGLVHGTTLVTNALIERRGAVTAMVTNEGFRDVIEMGREHRYDLYDLEIELPQPLVPRSRRFTISERTLAGGEILTPADESEVRELAQQLIDRDIEAVAVCLLHSHQNPESERRVRAILREEAPGIRVAISSEINPEIREYERFSTTIANVYVQGVVEDYLEDLRDRLRGRGVPVDPMIMLSNGGITSLEVAQKFPIRMLESGPAGGALGAVAFGRSHGFADTLAFDMGGTTAKACIIRSGQPLVSHTFEVNRLYRLKQGSGLPVRAPVIDMIEIGAGGGSIARVDSLGMISVGPDSAGSDPGPACYGRGGDQPTVTDADLVLGYLGADSFLGGRMRLDREAAVAAIRQHIAEPLGISVDEAAWGIHAMVNENMANAARIHAIERGLDVTALTMFASGGNGPLHGPGVAASLGQATVLAPPAAGVLSTLGFLAAAPSIDVMRSSYGVVGEDLAEPAAELLRSMEAEGAQLLRESGVPEGSIRHHRSVDMRYAGQGQEIEVEVPDFDDGWADALAAAFRAEYARRFGDVAIDNIDLETLTWRVRSFGDEPEVRLRFPERQRAAAAGPESRGAYFPGRGERVDVPVHDRYRLAPGSTGNGPAFLEETESTLLVPPDSRYAVLDDGSIRIDLQGDTTAQGDTND